MDKVVHFEIPVDDEDRAKAFYGGVFDWAVQDNDMGGGMNYVTVGTVATDEKMMPTEPGAINGGMMKRTDPKALLPATPRGSIAFQPAVSEKIILSWCRSPWSRKEPESSDRKSVV